MDDSYPLREKLTRETNYIEKTFSEYSTRNNGQRIDYFNFLQIVFVLAERNNKWMRGQTSLADKLLNQLNLAIQNKQKKHEDREVGEIGEKNEIILLAKILLEYIKQNRDELECLFGLANLFRLRSTFDLHFLHVYFKYDLYYKVSPAFKKRLFIEYFKMYRESDPN